MSPTGLRGAAVHGDSRVAAAAALGRGVPAKRLAPAHYPPFLLEKLI